MLTSRKWRLFGGGVCLGAALILCLAWPPAPLPPDPAPAAQAVSSTVEPDNAPPESPAETFVVRDALPFANASASDLAAADEAAALEEMAEQLAHPDPLTFRRLAGHLQHPAPTVRAAAREALRAGGDAAALPDLQLALETATQADEAAELAGLIAYLQLPSYTELRQNGQWSAGTGAQRTRVAAGVPVKIAPPNSPESSAPHADSLASLRAENQRLRLENQTLRAQAGLAATP